MIPALSSPSLSSLPRLNVIEAVLFLGRRISGDVPYYLVFLLSCVFVMCRVSHELLVENAIDKPPNDSGLKGDQFSSWGSFLW